MAALIVTVLLFLVVGATLAIKVRIFAIHAELWRVLGKLAGETKKPRPDAADSRQT
jgi:hypothetical protein